MNLFSILQASADTDGYYIAGYIVFFVVMIIYLASLYFRNRNLKEEYKLLTEDESDN